MIHTFVSMAFALILSVTPLIPNDVGNKWVTTPHGPVVIEQGEIWVMYPARLVFCSAVKVLNEIILVSEVGYCYLVDPRPIGYYEGDPTDPKSFDLPLISLTERTYNGTH